MTFEKKIKDKFYDSLLTEEIIALKIKYCLDKKKVKNAIDKLYPAGFPEYKKNLLRELGLLK